MRRRGGAHVMLDRGITLLRIRGIPVRLHPSLLVFLPYLAFVAMRQIGFVAGALGLQRDEFHLPPLFWGVVLAVGLFVAVLAHELAHSLVAIRSGVRVRSITLMMLGGVSLIEGELPPGREAWMAFAGPLASFAIAALAYGVFRVVPLPAEVRAALFAFAMTNGMLGVFNLLPAFPMDGGRVLRGLLAGRVGQRRATEVAAGLGKVMAVAFALYGIFSFNLVLLLIAWFVYAGAGAEQGRLSLRHALEGVPVRELMSDRLGEAQAEEPVGDVLRRLSRDGLAGARVWGPNGAPGRYLVGIVTADGLEGVAARGGATAPVTVAMEQRPPEAHPWDEATSALESLAGGDVQAVAVVDEAGSVVGVVTANELKRAAVLGRLSRS
jgi:Zn-dependent protease